jgi:hypothetical protein
MKHHNITPHHAFRMLTRSHGERAENKPHGTLP